MQNASIHLAWGGRERGSLAVTVPWCEAGAALQMRHDALEGPALLDVQAVARLPVLFPAITHGLRLPGECRGSGKDHGGRSGGKKMSCGFEAAGPRPYTGSMKSRLRDDMALCHVPGSRVSLRIGFGSCWGLV